MIDPFDFDKMQNLFSTNQDAFEETRKQILQDYFSSLPEHQRAAAIAQQDQLESLRKILTPEQYSAVLWDKISDSLNDLRKTMEQMKKLIDDSQQ